MTATPPQDQGVDLHVEALTRTFGTTTALDRVTFTVPAGRFLVLLGPSGSGKSTLLRCLAGIDRADIGTIRLGERVLAGGRTAFVPPERRDLAMVFQDYALWPHMTALANVGFALRRRSLGAAETRRRAAAMLERVGLADRSGHYPHQMSGGQQQRVALARALVGAPRLLLFDEPLSNLDADLRERLRVEIASLAREAGATAVYITHDQSEALALADEIGVMHNGALLQYGSPQDIYRRPASPLVARFTGMAAEMTGVVETHEHAGDQLIVRVRVADGLLSVSASEPILPGTPVTILIRPAATSLAPRGSGQGIPGIIRDTAYRGNGYDHVVETAHGVRLAGVHDPRAWPREDHVRLIVDPAGCLALPGEAAKLLSAMRPAGIRSSAH
ncbi:MAG: transporter related protein [Streptosporangiaceae bacterium]|jgi:iron(III) transport system ATP-binding protein|nr:transporter related protein [Streptosporangiaceae bacterium]